MGSRAALPPSTHLLFSLKTKCSAEHTRSRFGDVPTISLSHPFPIVGSRRAPSSPLQPPGEDGEDHNSEQEGHPACEPQPLGKRAPEALGPRWGP